MDNKLFANRLNDMTNINQLITKRILDLGFRYLGKDIKKLLVISSQISKQYKAKYGKSPIKRNQYINGETQIQK